MGDGWIQDPRTINTKRFHRDEKSWMLYPKVFIDSGRPLSDQHALLQRRAYVSMEDAKNLWHKLRKAGWKRVEPQWGAEVDI